jgi:hypothetical protein
MHKNQAFLSILTINKQPELPTINKQAELPTINKATELPGATLTVIKAPNIRNVSDELGLSSN